MLITTVQLRDDRAKWDSTGRVAAAHQELLLQKGKVVLIVTRVATRNVHSFYGDAAGSNSIGGSCYCEE